MRNGDEDISQRFLHECFDYNPQTGICVWKQRPLHHFRDEAQQRQMNTRCAHQVIGTRNKSGGYLVVKLHGKTRRLHRLIFKWMTGSIPYFVDHINHQVTDNRWSNLRAASHSQNQANNWRKRTRRYKGITPHHKGRKYVAQCANTYLGCFDTEEEAAMAYDAHAAQVFGEFAVLNFPTSQVHRSKESPNVTSQSHSALRR